MNRTFVCLVCSPFVSWIRFSTRIWNSLLTNLVPKIKSLKRVRVKITLRANECSLLLQYEILSGIGLNTTKTEIMRIGDDQIQKDYIIEDKAGQEVQIKSKVCGITYSYNERLAYQANITDKIENLESQLKRWLRRGLSLEGKIFVFYVDFP